MSLLRVEEETTRPRFTWTFAVVEVAVVVGLVCFRWVGTELGGGGCGGCVAEAEGRGELAVLRVAKTKW